MRSWEYFVRRESMIELDPITARQILAYLKGEELKADEVEELIEELEEALLDLNHELDDKYFDDDEDFEVRLEMLAASLYNKFHEYKSYFPQHAKLITRIEKSVLGIVHHFMEGL